MKWAIRILLVIVVLIVAVLVGAYFYADSLAKQTIERGGTYATGVRTTVDSVSLGLFAGEAGLSELQIANPEGFDTDYFLRLGEANTSVSLGTLMEDTVVIPRVHLDTIHLNLEHKDGEKNYQVILDNLERLSSGEEPAEPADAKQWVINDLQITDINVLAKVKGLAAESQTVEVHIPELVLTDVRSDSMAELQGQVIKQVLAAVIQQAGTQLPGIVLTELTAGVGRIGELGEATLSKVGEATAVVGKLGEKIGEISPEASEAVGEAADRAREGAGKVLEGATRGLGGLLGGDRDREGDDEGATDPDGNP